MDNCRNVEEKKGAFSTQKQVELLEKQVILSVYREICSIQLIVNVHNYW